MSEADNEKTKYSSVSIPMGIIEQIDDLIKELRYWPSRGAFVREACLEKIKREQDRIRERRGSSETTRGTKRGTAPDKRLDAHEAPTR